MSTEKPRGHYAGEMMARWLLRTYALDPIALDGTLDRMVAAVRDGEWWEDAGPPNAAGDLVERHERARKAILEIETHPSRAAALSLYMGVELLVIDAHVPWSVARRSLISMLDQIGDRIRDQVRRMRAS